jgi:hypothetical protein
MHVCYQCLRSISPRDALSNLLGIKYMYRITYYKSCVEMQNKGCMKFVLSRDAANRMFRQYNVQRKDKY